MKHTFHAKLLSAALTALLLLPGLAACRSDKKNPPDAPTAESVSETLAESSATPESAPSTDTESTPAEETAPDTTSETEPETEAVTVQLTGPYADSVMYADATKNKVQVYFADQVSRDVVIDNLNMQMILGTTEVGKKQVNALQNKDGAAYLRDTMDVYIRTGDGRTLYASESPAVGRLNIYRYGYYYYNTHILDQIFTDGQYAAVSEPLEIDKIATNGLKNDVIFQKSEDSVKFKVTGVRDPYVGLQHLSYDTADYNAVEIVLRTDRSASAMLFLAAGSQQWVNSDQSVSFSVTPGESFNTYLVPISAVPDYTGQLTSLRLDIGTSVDEIVEIKSMRLVKIDESVPAISLDRTLHAYADKLLQETHLVTTAATKNLAAYGMRTEIAADTVQALIAKDKNGTHSTLDGVDFASLEYIGFDIKDAGIFGYIKTLDYGGTVTVTLENGVYTVIQEIPTEVGKNYAKDTHLYMGTGLYTDATHDFADFLYAAACERAPLTVQVTNTEDGGAYEGYDSLRGAYRLRIDGSPGFQYNYENDLRRALTFEMTGDRTDRKVYIYTFSTGETLEAAVLLDENNRLLPIPVEVCKNFGHEHEEPVFVPFDDRFGEACFPLVAEADKANTLSVVNLYQDWGQFPLKQISSISFNAPYYHLSTGATESNCIANYFLSFMANNLLPDFRPMSQRFWVTQPQHTAGGILNFLSYTDKNGNHSALRHEQDEIKSEGPVYAELEMRFATYDERMEVVLEHIEMPQTDENRTYYLYSIKVLEDVTIADFKNNFTLFTMNSSNTIYQKLGYLDENNQPTVTNTTKSSKNRYFTLGKESPYFDLFVGDPGVHEDGYTNLAAIVKSYSFVIGGKTYDGNLILRESRAGNTNHADLTLDLGEVTLKAGDTLTFEMILMPWGEGQDTGISETDDIVRRVRMDSCIDPFRIEASVGTVPEHSFIPMVKATDGSAEFTLSGGYDTAVFYEGVRDNKNKVRGIAVRVFGFDAIGVPVVEERIDGKWTPVKLASDSYAYDGYSVRYEGDGTYSYTFAVDMTEARARTFRVTLNTDEKIFADDGPSTPDSEMPDTPDTPTVQPPVIDEISYTTNCVNSLQRMSFDNIMKDTSGTLYHPQQGGATAYIQQNPIRLDESWECVRIYGWAGYTAGRIVSYGYQINDGEIIGDKGFLHSAEQGVMDAGGQSRFTITVPLESTADTLLLRFYIILEDGSSVEMTRFWVLGSEEAYQP